MISIKDYTDFLNGKQKWIMREFTYDQYSRTTSIEYTTNGSDDIKEGHYYIYDLNSNITSERTVNSFGQANDTPYEEIREHTYDAAGRLTGTDITEKDSTGTVTKQESLTYAFDAAGNMTGKSIRNGEGSITETTVSTFNEFNQLTGSVTTDGSSTGIASAFTYDADNRLKTATETNGEIIEYTQENKYNGFGQRVQKKEGNDVTGYFYDGTSILYFD